MATRLEGGKPFVVHLFFNPQQTLLKSLNLTTLVLAATAALGLPAATQQAGFPTKPVTIITAFPAGSGPDAVLRQVSEKLSKLWGQPVLINNKPGGGGFVAIEASQRAPADGYTLVQFDSEHLSALPLLYKAIAGDVKAKIHADVLKVLADAEVKAKFDTFAFETITWSPDQIRQNAEAKGKNYEELVKRKNISLD